MRRRSKPTRQRIATLEAELLRRVRERGGLSRVQLSRELHLAPSTAGIYVDRLVRDGFLLETEAAGREAAGRPPTSLVPNPAGGLFIGVDFEARNLMTTAVDFSQQPLRHLHTTLRPTDSVEKILCKIEQAISELLAGDTQSVLGIGVGVPGSIDPETNVAVHYDFIDGWNHVPLGARLSARFGVPVFLENNIRSMALAELWFGSGRGLRNFVCVGIRSGVAAGIVENGHLLRGVRQSAGEIGHWACPVPAELSPDPPVRRSDAWRWVPDARLEHVASLPAILGAARRGLDSGRRSTLAAVSGELTCDHLLAAAREGDDFALALVRAAGKVHGWVAHQLIELLDPERIIFAGPLADLGEPFLAPVRETVSRWGNKDREAAIAGSDLGQFNGAVGAAALALHQWKPKR
jgi:predicted NBD/HSP70 family sugar kinase